MREDNIILTDIDGVVLNWFYAFDVWMLEHGHERRDGVLQYDVSETYGIGKAQAKQMVRMFNESAAMGFLPPLRDAMHYMKKLHEEHGYVFHAITSQSSNPNAQKLRIMNLQKLFGETLFAKFTILGCGDDKDEALEPYRDSGYTWVEDKVENAELGVKLGLDSLLMEHGFNMDHETIPCMKNWKDIYERLVG
jgi:hypothetical protein|tara:strand:- start:79 stop:657 length:579 start_codon:yes stop_codon:yes gene_type:complete